MFVVVAVVTSLSCTVFKILPFQQWAWLPVTLRSPSLSIIKLKSQATYAFRFMC